MDSERLSARARQPGHDQTFRVSEGNFLQAARGCLDPEKYEVEYQPRVLRDIFATVDETALGVRPDFMIKSRQTGRMLFVEVKKQGRGGNAEERSFKHHTVQFCKTLRDRLGYDFHPWVTVWCESLATDPRYTRKAKYLFEEDHYFLWVDYDPASLCSWLRARCEEWLDD
jgi:hypothetical protein